ncbi:uncharacterized protein VP01_965g5 [Puccinia sorghi]|uniref:Retrotransposon gag domain-containing protein n=1 Tax=Puccinia sorghi TaxID=27349 RepID=A0A0L6U873_9BASI|nr:uncharacterized protein VP01_965g5 [Puccinia sorghi]
MVLAKPQPFNRTCGAAAKYFVGQILLHTATYPEQFPTDSRKVAFAVLFMTNYAATWSQPYLMKVFNTEEVAFNKFLDDFNCPTIPPPKWNSVGLVQLTRSRKFPTCCGNEQHPQARKEWPTPILPTSTSAPTTHFNAMDLLAFQQGPHNRLSDAKQARQVQLNLCFCCGQARHVSFGCSNRSRKLHGRQQSLSSAWISELQAKINRIPMALKAGKTIEGIWNGQPAPIPPASSSAPITDPNAMDLSAFQYVETLFPLWQSRKYLLWIYQQEQEVTRSPAIFVFSPDF